MPKEVDFPAPDLNKVACCVAAYNASGFATNAVEMFISSNVCYKHNLIVWKGNRRLGSGRLDVNHPKTKNGLH